MAYSLSHSYFGDAFVSDFNWFNGNDPSNGFVRYQSEPDALDQGLYSINPISQAVILGVDHTNTFAVDEGRPSVRLESKQAYNHGLFIGDFAHMPPSVCGLWPAFWMYGPDWPNSGEIDIIEGANQATRNLISGHTSDGCTLPKPVGQILGQPTTTDCLSPGTNNNAGCGYVPNPLDQATYGDTFNAVGGGVYAMDWTSEGIKIWHWSRQNIPADIISKTPDPETWGLPTALFGTDSCDTDTYFKDMNIVIQTNFCGDYAGATWKDGQCGTLAPTCVDYVSSNPQAYANAYWEVNYIDVFERSVVAPAPSEEPTTTTTMATTSTIFVTVFPSGSNGTAITSAVVTTLAVPTSIPSGIFPPGALPSGSVPSEAPVAGPPSPSTDPIVPARDPASIGPFAFLGCFGSSSNFPTFQLKQTSADMTPATCVALCADNRYAAIHDDSCLCAESLDGETRALADREQCDIPCPGDANSICGGISPAADAKRDLPAGFLVSLYGTVGGVEEIPAPAPALGEGGVRHNVGPSPIDATITTITYVTVCPTNPAQLITTELRAPLCGCADDEPTFTTFVEICDGCGADGQNEVTLTVPITRTHVVAVTVPGGPTETPVIGTPPIQPVSSAFPTGQAPPGLWWPPLPEDTPTGFVQVDEAPSLSLGVAIGVPIAVALFRLVM
ncbi:hypothetical protein ACHAQH_005634 [Verticillium albo-atrum]